MNSGITFFDEEHHFFIDIDTYAWNLYAEEFLFLIFQIRTEKNLHIPEDPDKQKIQIKKVGEDDAKTKE